MGRVPEIQTEKLCHLFIGSGRLARHLKYYFTTKNIPVISWSRNKEPEFNSLDVMEFPQNKERLVASLKKAHTVWLLISDREIEKFIETHLEITTRQVVHCSGSLVVSGALSFHPMMTFAEDLYEPEFYEKILFVGESGQEKLRTICPELPNPYKAIEPRLKPLYHALCVASSNFTVVLWQQALIEFSRLGIEWNDLIPYLEQTTTNLIRDPLMALTGPLVRGDEKTIAKNLSSLRGRPLGPIYESFVQLYSENNKPLIPQPKGGSDVHA
ncbi:MAG: DUF2520 domain-containing protein [Bdellovibrionales bacterium]|nr:DUF2520 domain-containing protein [Bdellovibrionales bacterium]